MEFYNIILPFKLGNLSGLRFSRWKEQMKPWIMTLRLISAIKVDPLFEYIYEYIYRKYSNQSDIATTSLSSKTSTFILYLLDIEFLSYLNFSVLNYFFQKNFKR